MKLKNISSNYITTFYTVILSFTLLSQPLSAQVQDSLKHYTIPQLHSIIEKHAEAKAYKKLLPYAEAGLIKAKEIYGEQDTVYALMAYLLAYGYDFSGTDYKKAFEYYQIAEEIQEKAIPNSIAYISTLRAIADVYSMIQGDYKKAEASLAKAKKIVSKTLGISNSYYAKILNSEAISYELKGSYEQSEILYLETIKLKKEILGDTSSSYSSSLNDLALLYNRMGRYEEAETYYLQVKEIWGKLYGEVHPHYATVLGNLASLYDNMNKKRQAELLYLQTKKIKKEILGEWSPSYAVTINNLAYLYKSMGKNQDAESLFLEAKDIYKKSYGLTSPHYATVINNLGLFYLDEEKYAIAEALLLEAKTIREKSLGIKHPSYAVSLSNLGGLYTQNGMYKKAEPVFMEAKKIIQQISGTSHVNYARVLNNLSRLYFSQGKLDTAFTYSMSSIIANSTNFKELFPNLNDNIHDDVSIIKMYQQLQNIPPSDFLKLSKITYSSSSEIYGSLKLLLKITKTQFEKSASKNKLQVLYNLSKVGMLLNETTRNSFAGKKDKLRVLNQNNLFVKHGIDAALAIGTPKALEEAFSFSEQNKSILLADAIKGNRAHILGDLPDSIALKETKLQEKIDAINKQKAKFNQYAWTSEKQKATVKDRLVAKENKLNLETDLFLKSLKDKYPKYHSLKYQNIVAKVEDIQALLDEETLLLEYFVYSTKTYLLSLSKNNINIFPIDIDKEKLHIKTNNLRLALSDYNSIIKTPKDNFKAYTKSAFWFYQNFVAIALKENKNIKNLVIITDGELGHLPFEVFLVKENNTQEKEEDYHNLHYLIKDYNISYNYSATLLKENRHKNENNRQILACAAEYHPESHTKMQSISPDTPLKELRGLYLYNLRNLLEPLPATRTEIDKLSANFSGKFLTGLSANEATFKECAPEYGVIHLAMHGISHPRIPMLSSLAFTENGDSSENNFLQAYEISRLKLNADLVVLSACETGSGKFEQGEGIVSLARSFMYAGVPSLVVSLWQVNDGATAIIMKAFYSNLASGLNKTVALRQAKLDYLKNVKGVFAHPAFWSPFIQLGNSEAISLKTKGSWMPWAIGVIVLLLVISFFAFRQRKESA